MLGSARSVLLKKAVVTPTFPTPLVAYALDEGTGTTSADASGNGHTLNLNSTTWTTGHTNNGITGPGRVGGASSPLNAPGAAATIMGWVKPLLLTPDGGAPNSQHAFGFVDTGGGSDFVVFAQRNDLALGFPPNVLICNIRLDGSLTYLAGNAMTVGVWKHVAVTYTGTTLTIYENGTVANTTSAAGTISPGDNLWLAGWSDNTFDGDLVVDDVRVFNTALTQAEVVAAMNTPVA